MGMAARNIFVLFCVQCSLELAGRSLIQCYSFKMKAPIPKRFVLPKSGTAPQALPLLPMPELFNYTNYRLFLQDYYQSQKKVNPKFSLRYFAKKANFPSHGLLKYLMEGKRNLSKKTLVKLSQGLGLEGERSQYFENLVFFNQAPNLEEKNFYYEKLVRSPAKSTFRKMESSQLQIFRKWQNIAIREMLNLKGFRNNPAWISGQLLPPVEQYEVEESISTLLTSGIIKKTANGIKAADPDITTDDEVQSFLVKSYHAQMLKVAAWAQDEVATKERDISSVCFAIKESELPNLKKQIQLMRKELRNFAAADGEGERIVQVNIQLFPLSKGK
jgi:uncharacterized protein (TIGR02147 family)